MNQHQIDQLFAAIRDMSGILFEYKTKLKEQGFSDEETIELLKSFQKELIGNKN